MIGPVLLVEDAEDDVILTTRAWRLSHVVEPLYVVRDGQAALDYLAGQAPCADRDRHPLPCLVLLDLKLPYVYTRALPLRRRRRGSRWEARQRPGRRGARALQPRPRSPVPEEIQILETFARFCEEGPELTTLLENLDRTCGYEGPSEAALLVRDVAFPGTEGDGWTALDGAFTLETTATALPDTRVQAYRGASAVAGADAFEAVDLGDDGSGFHPARVREGRRRPSSAPREGPSCASTSRPAPPSPSSSTRTTMTPRWKGCSWTKRAPWPSTRCPACSR